jgi:SAM-dependent methyltransferase
MQNYALMYRLGITPWERYGPVARRMLATLLDREESERAGRLGRALDLGCGRGRYTPELARRGWEATGIDKVPGAADGGSGTDRGAGVADGSHVAAVVPAAPSAGRVDDGRSGRE